MNRRNRTKRVCNSLWEHESSVNHDVAVADTDQHAVHPNLSQPADRQYLFARQDGKCVSPEKKPQADPACAASCRCCMSAMPGPSHICCHKRALTGKQTAGIRALPSEQLVSWLFQAGLAADCELTRRGGPSVGGGAGKFRSGNNGLRSAVPRCDLPSECRNVDRRRVFFWPPPSL